MRSLFFLMLISVAAVHGQSHFSQSALALINSAYDEQNPIISADGNTLYFTVAGHPQNIEGKKAVGDIWYARWEGLGWSVPIHAGAAINSQDYNAVASLSGDGNTLFLLNHYAPKGESPKSQGISISRKVNGEWSLPENINIPYFLNKSLFISGQVTDDGNVFVFSAESYETKGVEDIYVSLKSGAGVWSEPKNLGSSINTPFQEFCPSLSLDQKTLYFSSNKPGGFGSFDVYSTTRLDDSWANWTQPQNLGSTVNTEGRELYFRVFNNDQIRLYTSTNNSDGYGDIKLLEENAKNEQFKEPVKAASNPLSITITGSIRDSKTGKPIQAVIEFKSDTLNTATSDENGKYITYVKRASSYSIRTSAKGYITSIERLGLGALVRDAIELNQALQPIEVGVSVNLKSVLFKVSETKLLPESFDELNAVVDLLKTNPKMEIELAGHTDSRGDAKLNQRLSQGRVDKVKEYLVSKGISAQRIQGKGYGGKKPIAFGDSEESRKLNRRVEFTIIKD